MKKTIRELPKEVLNYLGELEFKHGEDSRNIEVELNKFGWSLQDKDAIGLYNSLQGYLGDVIVPFEV